MIPIFILSTGIINLLICGLVLFKKHKRERLIYLISLSTLSPTLSFIAFTIFSNPYHTYNTIGVKLFLSIWLCITLLLLRLCTGLTIEERKKTVLKKNKLQLIVQSLFWHGITGIAVATSLSIVWVVPSYFEGEYLLIINKVGVFLFGWFILLSVYLLYKVENIYRFSAIYHRRMFHLFLLPLATAIIIQIILLTRIIHSKIITQPLIDTLIITYGVCLPIFLFSFFRYRLHKEKITITRGAIHASFTLLSMGALFLGLGGAVLVARHFNLSLSYFSTYLFLFSILFVGLLIVSSPTMRKRITRAVNTRIYKSKYDYQQQFFRLHRTYMMGHDLTHTINALVENLKETLTVSQIHLFIQSNKDGNFYWHPNPGDEQAPIAIINGDSSLAHYFTKDKAPLDPWGAKKDQRADVVLKEIALQPIISDAIIFPILNKTKLMGLLFVKKSKGVFFDYEDFNLIDAFALSIGDVYFKHQILQSQIESKQFDSFNTIASFIIHDIKNQVATLSLLTSNARKRINNPDFQKSLITSLQSTVNNLESLIGKFSSPKKDATLTLKEYEINTLIEEYCNASGIASLQDITLSLSLEATKKVTLDKEMLYYIILNLITNACDAMQNSGTLSVKTGDVKKDQSWITNSFSLSKHILSGKAIYVYLADTGTGMSPEYVATKLFHPFTSTKDKGVGIGLYQCKILLHKMDGLIFITSQLGKGTQCIILL